jgi:uncharacterized membrane protein YuzA (DUF378 family)
MSKTNLLGGQNYFLAVAYIVVGSVCLALALIFLGIFMTKRNDKRGSQSVQSVNNKH